jgi:hypothetical protein
MRLKLPAWGVDTLVHAGLATGDLRIKFGAFLVF